MKSWDQLQTREKRFLYIGGLMVLAIVLGTVGMDFLAQWKRIREEIRVRQDKISNALSETARIQKKNLASIVPAFEMPVKENDQKNLFRDRLNEQFQKAGFKKQPFDIETSQKNIGGFRRMSLTYKGKCQWGQLMDLLADLKRNPYFIGVERLSVKCDPKKNPEQRQEIDVALTVFTFYK